MLSQATYATKEGQCAHFDRPPQVASTQVVQQVSRRDVREIVQAAEESLQLSVVNGQFDLRASVRPNARCIFGDKRSE